MKPVTENTARAIAAALNVQRFDNHSYTAKGNAQRNLSGKTHYAEDDTLRSFSARIITTRISANGLIFAMTESTAGDYRNTARGFRFTAFDLFGDVLNDRTAPDSLLKTGPAAVKAMDEWLAGFDVLAHYKATMATRAERLKQDAATMAKAARAIKA